MIAPKLPVPLVPLDEPTLPLVDEDMLISGLLMQADFQEAKFTKTAFMNCQLSGATFLRTTLSGMNLRGNVIDGIVAELSDLKGAIISANQAVELIERLGLIVKV